MSRGSARWSPNGSYQCSVTQPRPGECAGTGGVESVHKRDSLARVGPLRPDYSGLWDSSSQPRMSREVVSARCAWCSSGVGPGAGGCRARCRPAVSIPPGPGPLWLPRRSSNSGMWGNRISDRPVLTYPLRCSRCGAVLRAGGMRHGR